MAVTVNGGVGGEEVEVIKGVSREREKSGAINVKTRSRLLGKGFFRDVGFCFFVVEEGMNRIENRSYT